MKNFFRKLIGKPPLPYVWIVVCVDKDGIFPMWGEFAHRSPACAADRLAEVKRIVPEFEASYQVRRFRCE